MKLQFYLNQCLPRLTLSYFSYFYFFLLILFFLWQAYINQPILCDSCVESINDMTRPMCSYPFNNISASHLENVDQDRSLFDNESIEPKCLNVFTNYQDICRRKLFWVSCVKSKGTFASYVEFKQSWNTSTKVWFEIKKELKSEIKTELDKIHLAKRTMSWILRPSQRNFRNGGNP